MENITTMFTHPSIPRNEEEPTFKAIQLVHKLLNQNATGILSRAYGNTLGTLGLTITPAAYDTMVGADSIMPTRPPPPFIPPFASNVQVTEIMKVYNKNLRTYSKYVATSKALKTQLLRVSHDNYFLAVYQQAMGHEGSTVLQLLQHLYTNYRQLDSTQITSTNNEICGDYDPTAPIEKYSMHVEKCMDIAANGGALFSLQ
eukprot:8106958-Ditylum_brightwellii.AAC.1